MHQGIRSWTAPAGAVTVLLYLTACPAWAQQHHGHTGPHAPGGHGNGHAPGTGHHSGGAYGYGAGYGYGAAYGYGGPSAGYGYGVSAAAAPRFGYGAAPSSLAAYLPYANSSPLPFSDGSAASGYYSPLTFAGFAPDPSADLPPVNRPPPDGAGHFELILPYDADVFVNDVRTMQTGFVRHYNTPKLTPGNTYKYRVRVRYVNAHGDIVEDTRDIRFRADDWFRIDFTRLPAPQAVDNSGAQAPQTAARK
jgi:uncharacterized protein (TIGR03000 family)